MTVFMRADDGHAGQRRMVITGRVVSSATIPLSDDSLTLYPFRANVPGDSLLYNGRTVGCRRVRRNQFVV